MRAPSRPAVCIAIALLVVAACSPAGPTSPAAPTSSAGPTSTLGATPFGLPTSVPSAGTGSPAPAGEPTAPGASARGTAPAGPDVRADAWTRLADALAALTEVAATAHQGRIWVAGGLRADGSVDDRVVVFDPGAVRWSDGPRLPEGVHHSSLVSSGADLYLIGGYAGSFPGTPTASVRRLDAAANRWVDGPRLPEARGAAAAAFDGSRIVFGGGVSSAGVSREVWALERGSDNWRLLGALARAREHLGATSDGQGRVWFLGGRAQSLAANVGTVEVIEGNGIRGLDTMLTPRSGVAAFWHPVAGACLAGGEGPAGTHAEVECVATDGRRTDLPRLAVSRHGLGAGVIDGVAYVVLGGRQPGLFVSPIVEALAVPGS